MKQEKYTPKQAKTAKRIIKYFAKFQARVFLLSNGKLWNKWSGWFSCHGCENQRRED